MCAIGQGGIRILNMVPGATHQIIIRDFERSAALDEHIRARAAKLEHYFSPITSCRIVAPHSAWSCMFAMRTMQWVVDQ